MNKDIDTIKKILLKLFRVQDNVVFLNAFYFDNELIELIKELQK
jgi:hypothetical protein